MLCVKFKKSIGKPLVLKAKGKMNPPRHFTDILPPLAGEVAAKPAKGVKF